MARVTLKNVCKSYPGENGQGIVAVNDLHLEIQDREFVVLVGPSGCGKSTTLRMIAGLESISQGDLFIDDRRMNDIPPKDRDIAMVFQNHALYPQMNVFENMALSLRLRRYAAAEIETRVREAAAILGLEPYLQRKPKALSGGQRQRAALGRAIVCRPKVFLFDEPLSNLDAKMRVQMRTEISKLHRRLDATMIYVTHDQVEAMTMGDRIAVMKDGIVQQIDAPLAVYERPANLFVAGFLGSPSMNFLSGRLSGEGSIVFQETGGCVRLDLGDHPEAKRWAGREVILGIRPEDCLVARSESAAPTRFEAIVELVEPMGAETCIYLQTGAHTLVSRGRSDLAHAAPGERRSFTIDRDKIHLFDPVSTDRLS